MKRITLLFKRPLQGIFAAGIHPAQPGCLTGVLAWRQIVGDNLLNVRGIWGWEALQVSDGAAAVAF